MRDAKRGAPNTYRKWRAKRRCGDYDWLSGWQDSLGQRRAGAKPWAIRAVRRRALVRMRMIVVRVSVGGLVGGTVLDDLAVSTNVDVGVGEDRGQRRKRYREPGEQQVPTHYHQVTDAKESKNGSRAGVSTMWICFSTFAGLDGRGPARNTIEQGSMAN